MNPAAIVPVRSSDPAVAGNLVELANAAAAHGVPLYVVDNGMPAEAAAALSRVEGVRMLSCAAVGSYRARNAGVRAALAAGHDALLFTDADCRPLPGWPGHLVGLLDPADVVVSVAPPRPTGRLGRGSHLDYLYRLRQWAGGPLVCGEPVRTMDTRACAVRAEVFGERLFDEELSFAGDAVFGREAVRSGRRVVACDHPVLSHDPPRSWLAEYRKHHRIAATLTRQLRAWPRRRVLQLLPEHVHLLLPPRPGQCAASRRRLVRAVFDTARTQGHEQQLYAAWREAAWIHGWAAEHRRRLSQAAPDLGRST